MSWTSMRRTAIGIAIFSVAVQAGCDNGTPSSSTTPASNQVGVNPPQGQPNSAAPAIPSALASKDPNFGVTPARQASAAKPDAHAGHDHDHDHDHAALAATVEGLPPVRVEPASIEFGTVKPGVRMTGSTEIYNTGNKPLKISQSKADCACTSVDLANTIIQPGQSVPLKAHFIGSTLGSKTAGVRVLFEGYPEFVEVPVRAMVALPVRADPSFINGLPQDDGTLRDSGEYEVSSSDRRPFNILAVNGGHVPFIDFTPGVDSPRSVYRLRWDFSVYDSVTCKDSSGQRLPGWIVVETDHPDCPVFDLEVRHECVRRVPPTASEAWVVTDKRTLVGALREGETAEFEVVAKFLPRRPTQDVIKSVVSESPRLTAELLNVQRISDGMLCKIRVKALPGPKGMLFESLRLQSDHQNGQLFVIGTVR